MIQLIKIGDVEMEDITFLSVEEIKQSKILKKYGKKCSITDFSILLGGYVSSCEYTDEGNSQKERVGWWWTKSSDVYDGARVVNELGSRSWYYVDTRHGGARPALPYLLISSISSNVVRGKNGILEVEYGEYPQTIVSKDLSVVLEKLYQNEELTKTGKSYTTDSTNIYADTPFRAIEHIEYEYNGKKYIRILGGSNSQNRELSDGRTIKYGEPYWVEVEPIKWMIDEKNDVALSKYILFSGVQFNNERNYTGNFKETDIYKFLVNHFIKDIVPSKFKNKEYKNINKAQQEIKKLLDEIYLIIDNMPNEFRDLIIERINNIIEENKKNKNNPKPTMNLDKSNKEINLTLNSSVSRNKNTIEEELRNIIEILSRRKEYTDLVGKTKIYRKLFDENITNLPEDINSIENIIKSIIYFANLMDDDNKNKIITKLNSILDEPQKVFEILLKSGMSGKVGLTLDYNNNPEQDLMKDLCSYLDEVIAYHKKFKDYTALLKSLTDDEIDNPKNINDINDIINNTNYAISKIDDLKDKERLIKEFNQIKDKYIEILRDNINNESVEDSYEKTVLSLHEDLHPLLIELNTIIKREQIIKNIRRDLLLSISMIKEMKTSDDFKPSVITSFTEEIIKEINNSSLNHSEVSEFILQILEFINDRLALLENIELTVNEEELEKKINNDFAGLYIDVVAKILEINNHNIVNLKDKEILNFLENYQETKTK